MPVITTPGGGGGGGHRHDRDGDDGHRDVRGRGDGTLDHHGPAGARRAARPRRHRARRAQRDQHHRARRADGRRGGGARLHRRDHRERPHLHRARRSSTSAPGSAPPRSAWRATSRSGAVQQLPASGRAGRRRAGRRRGGRGARPRVEPLRMADLPAIGLRVPQYGSSWDAIRDAALRIEALGFDSVWVNDHLQSPGRVKRDPTFDAFTTLARPRAPDRAGAPGHGGAVGQLPAPAGRGEDGDDHRRHLRRPADPGPRLRVGRAGAPGLRHPVPAAARAHGAAVGGPDDDAGDVRAATRTRRRTCRARRRRAARRSGSPPTGRGCCGWRASGPTGSWPRSSAPRRRGGACGRRAEARPDGPAAAGLLPLHLRAARALARRGGGVGARPRPRPSAAPPRRLPALAGRHGDRRGARRPARDAGGARRGRGDPRRPGAAVARAARGRRTRWPRRSCPRRRDAARATTSSRSWWGAGSRTATATARRWSTSTAAWTFAELEDAARAGGRRAARRGRRRPATGCWWRSATGAPGCRRSSARRALGAVAVPADPTEPERLALLAEDCEPAVVVSAEEEPPPGRVVRPGELDAGAPAPVVAASAPDDLAYLIYSSGSTGRPKGVMHGHGGHAHGHRDLRGARCWAWGPATAATRWRACSRRSASATASSACIGQRRDGGAEPRRGRRRGACWRRWRASA